LEDSASRPERDIIMVDVIENLRTALEQLEEITGDVAMANEVRNRVALGYTLWHDWIAPSNPLGQHSSSLHTYSQKTSRCSKAYRNFHGYDFRTSG
jgi:hypothetical protein